MKVKKWGWKTNNRKSFNPNKSAELDEKIPVSLDEGYLGNRSLDYQSGTLS